MFREYCLATHEEFITEQLNDPKLMAVELNVECVKTTGYTFLLARFQEAKEPIVRKRRRYIRRFLLLNGMNEELDTIYNNRAAKVLSRYDFFTEQGGIIVLDYEVLE